MNKITSLFLLLTVATASVFVVCIPKARSALAEAQAEAKAGNQNVSAQSYAEAQSGLANSFATSNGETESISSNSWSNSPTLTSSEPYIPNPSEVQESTVSEPEQNTQINTEETLSEIKISLQQNKERLESAGQKLNDIESRQIKLLKMFILNLAILIIITFLETLLVFKYTRR